MIIILFKAFFFIYYIYVAAISYLNIYLNDIGISATQLGLMSSIAKSLAIIVIPFWGILADYFSANKKVLQIAIFGVFLSQLAFLSTKLFWPVLFIYIIHSLFDGSIVPLNDSLLLSNLKKKANNYGKYRVWGSVGYLLFVTPFGYILERTDTKYLFLITASILFITLINTVKLPEAKKEIKVSRLADFKLLMRNKELLHFLIFTFFIQITLMGHFTYFPILFIEKGGGETLYGVAMLIGAASELIIFQKSDFFFKTFKLKTIFLVSSLAFTMRWFLVATFQIPEVLLLTQLFHSLTYGLFYVTAVNFVSRIVKEEFRATGQNLYASTISISSVISSLIGGIIYDNLGASALYLLGTMITLLAGLVYYYALTRKERTSLTV